MRDNDNEPGRGRIREHLANERTFLAWVRTGIAILALGFVFERFSVFVDLIKRARTTDRVAPDLTRIVGLGLIVLAALIIFLAASRFKITERQIARGSYRPSLVIDYVLAGFLILVALLAIFYLAGSLLGT
ncbi:MAG: YidH family protein [Desulfotomaculales bacterium]